MLICVYNTANEAEILKAKITQIATAAYRRIARWNNFVYAVVRVPKPGTYPKEYGPGAFV